jgi:hypothetical protein
MHDHAAAALCSNMQCTTTKTSTPAHVRQHAATALCSGMHSADSTSTCPHAKLMLHTAHVTQQPSTHNRHNGRAARCHMPTQVQALQALISHLRATAKWPPTAHLDLLLPEHSRARIDTYLGTYRYPSSSVMRITHACVVRTTYPIWYELRIEHPCCRAHAAAENPEPSF